MDTMKTTVYLPAAEYRRLKALAEQEGRPTAALIREAVSEYARARTNRKLPRSIGIAHSREPDLAERTDELLEGFGEA